MVATFLRISCPFDVNSSLVEMQRTAHWRRIQHPMKKSPRQRAPASGRERTRDTASRAARSGRDRSGTRDGSARPRASRPGRRAGDSTSRDEILAAARACFAEHGYAATSLRQIARNAGVDPALVHYFFGSKEALFASAMELPYSPAQIFEPALADRLDGAGARIVRRLLEVWEDPAAQAGLLTLIRSAATHPHSANLLQEFITRELRPRIAAAVGTPDADLRATLVGSALVGVAFERFVLRLEPLASADRDTVVAWVGPTVQRYLTGNPA
jgi:AcrR family transcriptional regulator